MVSRFSFTAVSDGILSLYALQRGSNTQPSACTETQRAMTYHLVVLKEAKLFTMYHQSPNVLSEVIISNYPAFSRLGFLICLINNTIGPWSILKHFSLSPFYHLTRHGDREIKLQCSWTERFSPPCSLLLFGLESWKKLRSIQKVNEIILQIF